MNKAKSPFSAVIIAASVNLGLFFTKLYIGLSSNSVAIYADSLNNLLDFGVCLAAVTGFALLSRKKSEDYPYGTGKTEDLIEFIISVAITVSGLCFGYASVERIMYPMPVWYSMQYAVIIAVTAAVKLILAAYMKTTGNKTESGIVKGIASDSMMDFFITLCCFISFTLSSSTGFSVDGVAGIAISITMTVQGIKSAIRSCSSLIGKNDITMCEKAKEIIKKDPSVSEVLSVSCHRYGQNKVFNAKINPQCESAPEITEMYQRLSDSFETELDAIIYISFGGVE